MIRRHKYLDQGATNSGSPGCVAAFRDAQYRTNKEGRSMAVRVTEHDIWFACDIRVAKREHEIEVATIHCDGRTEFTK